MINLQTRQMIIARGMFKAYSGRKRESQKLKKLKIETFEREGSRRRREQRLLIYHPGAEYCFVQDYSSQYRIATRNPAIACQLAINNPGCAHHHRRLLLD